MSFVRQFDAKGWRVVVEDDDRVAYAYLLRGNEIVSDVWLYNRGPAPGTPPWNGSGDMPFCNSAEYVKGDAPTAVDPDTVDVRWQGLEGNAPEPVVLVEGQPIAGLASGKRPGWSVFAERDGPVARVGPPD